MQTGHQQNNVHEKIQDPVRLLEFQTGADLQAPNKDTSSMIKLFIFGYRHLACSDLIRVLFAGHYQYAANLNQKINAYRVNSFVQYFEVG